jgi:uncharacterized membrane protein
MKPTPIRKLVGTSWFIPMAYTVTTLLVGMTFPRLEHHFLPQMVSSMSASSAMSVCSAIASGMIALTGIVFSLTFVMVQFSATAYSPRLVLWLARDRVMSHSLGVFISTFLYALIMLAWVDRYSSGTVPFVSSWMVVGLLLASMAMFIKLIQRITLLQINRMLIFTASRGRAAIDELYVSRKRSGGVTSITDSQRASIAQTLLHFGRPGVVQAINIPELVNLATQAGTLIEMTVTIGDSLVESTPLLRVVGAQQHLNEQALRDALEIGDERTFEQDPKYAIRLIVDIAIKALSPAINDPTTAVQALDQIEDLLLRLGRVSLDIGAYDDEQGKLRLLVPFPTWEDFLHLALGEIQHYGADSVQVMRRMKALLENLIAILPPERRPALLHWEERLCGTINRAFVEPEERIAASVADRQGLGLGEHGNHQRTRKMDSTAHRSAQVFSHT